MLEEPQTHIVGTTGGGTTTTSFLRPGSYWWMNHYNIFLISWELLVEEPLQHLSQGIIMEELSEGILLNVYTVKDEP